MGVRLDSRAIAAVMGLGLNSMGSIQTRVNEIVDHHNEKTFQANERVDNFRDITLSISNIVMQEDEAAKQEPKSRLAAAREKYGKAKKVLLNMQLDETQTKLTQQNAALVEEAAAAAQSLQEQAGALSQVVSVFRLGNEHQITQGVSARTASGGHQKTEPRQPPGARQTIAAPPRKVAKASPVRQLAAAPTGAGDWEEF